MSAVVILTNFSGKSLFGHSFVFCEQSDFWSLSVALSCHHLPLILAITLSLIVLITTYSILWLEIWLAFGRKPPLCQISYTLIFKETTNYHPAPTLPCCCHFEKPCTGVWRLLQMRPDNESLLCPPFSFVRTSMCFICMYDVIGAIIEASCFYSCALW